MSPLLRRFKSTGHFLASRDLLNSEARGRANSAIGCSPGRECLAGFVSGSSWAKRNLIGLWCLMPRRVARVLTDDASLMSLKETLEDGKGIDGRPRTAYEGQRGHYKLELPST